MSLQKPFRKTVDFDQLPFAFVASMAYVLILFFTKQPFDALYSVIALLAITEVIVHIFYIQEMTVFASFLRFAISMIPVFIIHCVFLNMLGLGDNGEMNFLYNL